MGIMHNKLSSGRWKRPALLLAGLADDPAFVGYPYPLARAHQAARVTGYQVVDVRRGFRDALSRHGMHEDDIEVLFQDFHEVLNRS